MDNIFFYDPLCTLYKQSILSFIFLCLFILDIRSQTNKIFLRFEDVCLILAAICALGLFLITYVFCFYI